MAGKLKFAQNLYLGEGIAPEKLDKLKKRLNKKPLLANVYLITPARIPADQLDIFDARLFDMEEAASAVPPGDFSDKVWTLENRRVYKPTFRG